MIMVSNHAVNRVGERSKQRHSLLRARSIVTLDMPAMHQIPSVYDEVDRSIETSDPTAQTIHALDRVDSFCDLRWAPMRIADLQKVDTHAGRRAMTSIMAVANHGKSSGLRLDTKWRSTTTGASSQRAPALTKSSMIPGEPVTRTPR